MITKVKRHASCPQGNEKGKELHYSEKKAKIYVGVQVSDDP